MIFSRSLIISLLLLLGACGGGSGGFTPPTVTPPAPPPTDTGGSGDGGETPVEETISIVASLGLIKNADVTVSTSDGTAIGSATSGEDGTVSITHDGSYTGPVLVTVSGNDTATYFDEAKGLDLPLPIGSSIRAYAPSPLASIGVTILTELAAQLVANLEGAVTADDITAINESVRANFAPDVSDILLPPVLVSADNFNAQALVDDEASKYALRIAALAGLASGTESPALAILNQLSSDLADGDIDGLGVNGALSGLSYTVSDFAGLFQNALQLAASTLAGSDLLPKVADFKITTSANFLQSLLDQGLKLKSGVADLINPPQTGGGSDSGSGGSTGGNTGTGGVDISGNYDLTLSGQVITFGVGSNFELVIKGIVAPSPNDTAAVTKAIEESVAGVSNITNLTITVVTNTTDRITFDVSLDAQQSGVSIQLKLRYDYVKVGGSSGSGGTTGSGGTDSGTGSGTDTGTGTGSSGAVSIADLGKICFFGGEPSAITSLPSYLTDGVLNLNYHQNAAGAPYGDGELAHFFIGTDLTLDINRQVKMTTPVLCGSNEHEAIWKDLNANLLYSVTDLITGFNEINVNSGVDGKFLGQFRKN